MHRIDNFSTTEWYIKTRPNWWICTNSEHFQLNKLSIRRSNLKMKKLLNNNKFLWISHKLRYIEKWQKGMVKSSRVIFQDGSWNRIYQWYSQPKMSWNRNLDLMYRNCSTLSKTNPLSFFTKKNTKNKIRAFCSSRRFCVRIMGFRRRSWKALLWSIQSYCPNRRKK